MRAVRGGAGAVAFLTRLPVGLLVTFDGTDVASGAPVFPLVGAGVGAAVAGVAIGLTHVLPALAASGIALAFGAALTGALHLDALADTADALTKRGERALAVMRDHATGAYGATALVLDLLVKAAVLAALVEHGHALGAATAAGALSRAVPLAVGTALPPVRAEGAGESVRFSRAGAAGGVAVAVAAAFAAGAAHGPELALTAAVLVGAAISAYRRWLGGVTGDLLGAATEVSETVLLLVAAALTGSR